TFYTLTADPNISDQCFSYFQTSWGGNTICGFLDSGSQAMDFPNLAAPNAIPYDSNADSTSGYYTPASSSSFSGTNIGYGGAPSVVTPFYIENISSNISGNNVFSQWGVLDQSGPISGLFDWGLPFFLGRTVFIGLEGTSSSVGTGMYWAYPTSLYT